MAKASLLSPFSISLIRKTLYLPFPLLSVVPLLLLSLPVRSSTPFSTPLMTSFPASPTPSTTSSTTLPFPLLSAAPLLSIAPLSFKVPLVSFTVPLVVSVCAVGRVPFVPLSPLVVPFVPFRSRCSPCRFCSSLTLSLFVLQALSRHRESSTSPASSVLRFS